MGAPEIVEIDGNEGSGASSARDPQEEDNNDNLEATLGDDRTAAFKERQKKALRNAIVSARRLMQFKELYDETEYLPQDFWQHLERKE